MILRYKPLAWFGLTASVALLVPKTSVAQQEDSTNLNHFSFSARIGFNVTARFKNLGTLSFPGLRTTPDGNPYNYDNGYVLTDVSGSAGGQTWNWGYDSASQISGNNSIYMSKSTPLANVESPYGTGAGNANPGFEISYDRQLGSWRALNYGVEGALNFMRVAFSDSSSFSGTAQQTADEYPYTPGTTPPLAPYQGTFNGPGFLLGSSPISSTSSTVGATIVGQRKFSSDIYGLRLGPYFEYPLTEKLDLWVSGGLAAGLLVNHASLNEVLYIGGIPAAYSSGSGHNTGFVWGGYVSADLSYQLSRRWNVEAGAQFQDMGVYTQDIGSREVELDLSRSLFVTVSAGFKF